VPDVTAGMVLDAGLFPPTKYVSDPTVFTVTSDTFTLGGHPWVATTFIVNRLGKIKITVGGIAHGATDTRVDLVPEIWLGTDATGTLLVEGNFTQRGASSTTSTKFHTINRGPILISGLPQLATCYARLLHRREGTASTGEFFMRNLTVEPAF
jgi:hypothetical protein